MSGSSLSRRCALSACSSLERGKLAYSAIDVGAMLVGALFGVAVGSSFLIMLSMLV